MDAAWFLAITDQVHVGQLLHQRPVERVVSPHSSRQHHRVAGERAGPGGAVNGNEEPPS